MPILEKHCTENFRKLNEQKKRKEYRTDCYFISN